MFLFVCLLQIRRLYMKLEGITCSTHAGVTLVEGKTAKHKTATKGKGRRPFCPCLHLERGSMMDDGEKSG